MPADLKVDVEGLKELRRELRRLEGDFPKQLQQTNKKAAELVVPEAKRRAGQGRSNLAGGIARGGSKLVGSVRALASQSRAQIAMGGARVPWAGGSDWGSSGRYRQFAAKSSEGYILYPAVKAKREEVVETYGEMIDDLTKRAFPG